MHHLIVISGSRRARASPPFRGRARLCLFTARQRRRIKKKDAFAGRLPFVLRSLFANPVEVGGAVWRRTLGQDQPGPKPVKGTEKPWRAARVTLA